MSCDVEKSCDLVALNRTDQIMICCVDHSDLSSFTSGHVTSRVAVSDCHVTQIWRGGMNGNYDVVKRMRWNVFNIYSLCICAAQLELYFISEIWVILYLPGLFLIFLDLTSEYRNWCKITLRTHRYKVDKKRFLKGRNNLGQLSIRLSKCVME